MTAVDGPVRRRRRFVALIATSFLAVMLVAGAGAFFGPQLRSPAQVAAEAAPPPPSVVTAEAARRELSEPVVLRGQLRPGQSIKVLAPAAALGPNSVVTKVAVKKGERLREGRVVLERAGQPMFVLNLAFPLYRDITAGLTGPDVAEIQRALRRIGYRVPVSGKFDSVTRQQVSRFYQDRGYPAGSVGDDDRRPATNVDETDAEEAGEDRQGARLERTSEIPQAAVLVVNRPNKIITAVPARVGQVLTDAKSALLELDGKAPAVVAIADRDQAALLRAGQKATATDDLTGEDATATVTTVGKDPVADAAGQNGFQVRFQFTGEPIGGGVNRSLRLDVQLASGGAEVLAVPVTAIYSRPDGTTFVTTVSPEGKQADVTVTTGRTAGGWVEIVEPDESSLSEGVPVVVGDQAGE
ncbi:peptidoglycan-binding protein [Actinoplanes sp. NPDC049118]|uniref:peptidoglycan-binding protein n=1 Tax=Actinoplanes sp. NPDC049118 TaxID=3155769 RepID=UPI0033EA9B36